MGFFDEAKSSIIRFSDILVTKTEMYAKIAKLNFEIKKKEYEISKVHSEIGQSVFNLFESGAKSINIEDPKIRQNCLKIKTLKEEIESKQKEIETIEKAGN